jgi:quercetin dioxygenase-like cupin family protein
MSYSPSPRPTFERTTAIPYASVTRYLWGDAEAGEVADWIYVSSGRIHQIVFGLEPGGWFRHSDAFRTIFAADEVFHVLAGTMIIANPETGEVHQVRAGESAFFRRDTWHHVFNEGPEELRVLEVFAPPPSTGTSGKYAQSKPNLTDSRYLRDDLLGRWPMARAEVEATNTIQVVRDPDLLWRYEGTTDRTLVGLVCATDHLTAGTITLQPGQRSDFHAHGGDESLLVSKGTVFLEAHDPDGRTWLELGRHDGAYVPSGVSHRYWNRSSSPAEIVFAVAPEYLP